MSLPACPTGGVPPRVLALPETHRVCSGRPSAVQSSARGGVWATRGAGLWPPCHPRARPGLLPGSPSLSPAAGGGPRQGACKWVQTPLIQGTPRVLQLSHQPAFMDFLNFSRVFLVHVPAARGVPCPAEAEQSSLLALPRRRPFPAGARLSPFLGDSSVRWSGGLSGLSCPWCRSVVPTASCIPCGSGSLQHARVLKPKLNRFAPRAHIEWEFTPQESRVMAVALWATRRTMRPQRETEGPENWLTEGSYNAGDRLREPYPRAGHTGSGGVP